MTQKTKQSTTNKTSKSKQSKISKETNKLCKKQVFGTKRKTDPQTTGLKKPAQAAVTCEVLVAQGSSFGRASTGAWHGSRNRPRLTGGGRKRGGMEGEKLRISSIRSSVFWGVSRSEKIEKHGTRQRPEGLLGLLASESFS